MPDRGEDAVLQTRRERRAHVEGVRQLAQEVAGLRAEQENLRREVARLHDRLSAVEAEGEQAGDRGIAEALPPTPDPFPPRGEGAGGRGASSPTRWETRVVTVITVLAVAIILALTIGPRLLPYQTYVVLSGSMQPTLPVGAVVVLLPAAAERLAPGEIITFQRPDRPTELVTHRIVGVEQGPNGRFFVTKGDANGVPDAWRVPAVGNGWRFAFALPHLGYVLRAFQSAEGRLAFLIVPAIGLGLLSLVEVWRPRRQAIEST